ncbi:COP9 signalosome complex subunit 7b [Homalodisca vitripennis]|nr:COP9 signalosome complex subunit 7b [Homalodisca vitripennis]
MFQAVVIMTSDKADKNASSSTSSNNPLEQFVLLAKSAKGAAAMELIRQVLAAPGVHVFGELLDMPNIKEVDNLLCSLSLFWS